MISITELRIDNWLVDTNDDNLCVVKALAPRLLVERLFDRAYQPNINLLKGVYIEQENLSLAQFVSIMEYITEK